MRTPSKQNHPSLLLTTAVVILLSAAWGYVRLILFRESVLPLTFVLPLLTCVWTRRRWQLWGMAAAYVAMVGVKCYGLLPDEAMTSWERHTAFGASALSILIGAVVVQSILALRDGMEARNERITSQNAELEAQAEELAQQNEEIKAQTEELAQQNEEIESQAEELRHQNEELQDANVRLGSREGMLQAILQSARTAAGGQQVLDEVCRRALDIIGGPAEALAVLVADDDGTGLRLRAHARHETQPPPREYWPLEESLARVVLKEDRTAYVDDLRERTDLAAPFTADSPVRSLLATPLRVAGEQAGVVVVCSRDASHWTRDQFRLAEWVSAQCGLIVEGLHWQDALKERAAEVEAANRAKDQFLATLSHELRTPLTPVLVAAGTLERDPRLPDDMREDIGVIRRNVAVQSRLIDDLLDLTRIGRGKLDLHRQDLPIADLLRDAAAIVAADLDAKEQTLTMEFDLPQGTCVNGDDARLQQIFWNLLKNAVKFSPTRGRIALSARLSAPDGPRAVVIDIVDNGAGIEPADFERIFLPFEQITAGGGDRRGKTEGLGLGLYIVKAVVEYHGGSVRADSAGAGKGSTFTVVLPLSEAPATSSPDAAGSSAATRDDATASPAPDGSPLRILLVEDHADTGRLMKRLLANQGHAVTHAPDVASAVKLFREGTYDLLLSDLGLPDGTGIDLMRQIRAMRPDLTGICLSGYGMESDVRSSQDAGFAEHLTKPVDVRLLQAAIGRAVHRMAGGRSRPTESPA